MGTKNSLMRITIDLPANLQKKLKVAAAMNGISMRQVVIQSIENQLKKIDSGIANQAIEDKN